MKSLSSLNPKQNKAIDHIYEYGETYLIGDMGSGKTVVMLAAINDLLAYGAAKKVLIVSTPKICETVWQEEAGEWQELAHLVTNIKKCTGKLKSEERLNVIAEPDTKIVLISFDLIPWLFEKLGKNHGFDALFIDEATKLAAGGKQFKALRPRLRDFETRVCATGTPVEESWQQLFYPIMICDLGEALGTRKDAFLNSYFFPLDYEQRQWQLRMGGDKHIYKKIKHLIVNLPDYKHELPKLTREIVMCVMPQASRDYYEEFKRSQVDSEREIVAENAAVLVGKLQQIANGFIYSTDDELTDEKHTYFIHGTKNNLLNILLLNHLAKKIIVVYQFEEEKRRLQKSRHDVVFLNPKKVQESINEWRDSKNKNILAIHPKSAGHGLRLEQATVMIFMSPIWSRDQTEQTISRMHRRGQEKECIVYTLCMQDTIETEIIGRVDDKATHGQLLKKHLNADK